VSNAWAKWCSGLCNYTLKPRSASTEPGVKDTGGDEVIPLPVGWLGAPISASLSKCWRMSCKLVSRVERWEAIVESAIRSSKWAVADEAKGRVDIRGMEAVSWVVGPAGWATVPSALMVWNEGRDKLSMSTGLSFFRSIFTGSFQYQPWPCFTDFWKTTWQQPPNTPKS